MSAAAKKRRQNPKRFNEDQIKFLETTFQTKSTPELRLKQNLADKLGLQPRQVAIWFQNKRARSKSKEIEREYNTLKADYDNLSSQFEAAKKENQTLIIQVQRLKEMAAERDSKKIRKENHFELANYGNWGFLREINGHDLCMPPNTDLNTKVNNNYLQEAKVAMNLAPQVEGGYLTSPGNGWCLESNTSLDHMGTYTTQWWEF